MNIGAALAANLDKILESIPDEPHMGGYMVPSALCVKAKPSNSIKDWVKTLKIYGSWNVNTAEDDFT